MTAPWLSRPSDPTPSWPEPATVWLAPMVKVSLPFCARMRFSPAVAQHQRAAAGQGGGAQDAEVGVVAARVQPQYAAVGDRPAGQKRHRIVLTDECRPVRDGDRVQRAGLTIIGLNRSRPLEGGADDRAAAQLEEADAHRQRPREHQGAAAGYRRGDLGSI